MNPTAVRTALLLAVGSLALAHQPLFNPGSPSQASAYPILEPTVSKVITAEAKTGGLDWYALEVAQGFNLDVALFVGAPCPKAFNPRLYLIGPGLTGKAPFATPEGTGALAVAETWTDYSGHGVVARKGPTLTRTLNAGKYHLVVQHTEAKGWYFLSLGGSEAPGGTAEGRAALVRFNRCG